MGKWCRHASSFIFDQIIVKVTGNQNRHESSDEFDFTGPDSSAGRVSAPGNGRSRVRAATYQSRKKWY